MSVNERRHVSGVHLAVFISPCVYGCGGLIPAGGPVSQGEGVSLQAVGPKFVVRLNDGASRAQKQR